MDSLRFDALARVLSAPDSRRRVLGLLTAVPVVGGLLGILSPEETEAAGRRKRRKKAHKHGKGRRRKHKHKKPQCTPTTCAAQGTTCGNIPDGCGKTLNCGPCTCATGCHAVCQTCNPATDQCDPVANDTPCDDGNLCTLNDVCTDGVCGGSPKCGGGQGCVAGVCCLLPAATGATKGLQEAINGAAAGTTIRLCAGTWEVSSTVVINKNLTLTGAGDGETVLDGGDAVQVLLITPGHTVTLQTLMITKGDASDVGGIYNDRSTLTLGAGSRVTGNRGGGVFSYYGTLTLQSGSSVTGNSTDSGGGISIEGGAVTLQNGSRVSGNTTSTGGGGIFTALGTVTVEPEALVCNNSAPQCSADSGTFIGACPNPSNGVCPS